MANTFNAITTGTGGVATTGDSSGAFSFTKDGGSAEVYIDASGNVGIGTSSPSQKLNVQGNVLLTNPGNSLYTYYDSTATWTGRDSASGAYVIGVASSERMRINSSGQLYTTIDGFSSTYAIYGCRAWCKFTGNGSVGAAAIQGSGNVTSVSKTATGLYTVSLATAMPDINYAITGAGEDSPTVNRLFVPNSAVTRTTTQFGCGTVAFTGGVVAPYDSNPYVYFAVFR